MTEKNNQKAIDCRGVKCCLIFPPYQESEDNISLKTAKKNLGKIPPLCLCAVAATLERCGATVRILDVNACGYSIEDVIDKVLSFAPDFLGYTLSTYQFHFTLEWINRIKARTGIPVIVGGPHVRIYPREILTHHCIDYCVTGDAEITLPHLVYSLMEKKNLAQVSGVAYRENGDVRINDAPVYSKNLDETPFPARHLLDNSLYSSLLSKYKNFTGMTSSRGCVFQCTFCDNHCIPYRAMSPRRVVDEMEECQREFNINEIDMFDGVFSLSKRRLSEICEQITRRKLRIAWSFRTRADLIDKEILQQLRSAGCMRIYYGIESGSPRILKNIKKNEELTRIRSAITLTKQAGIDTFGFFMVGNYGETRETIKETRDLISSLPLDYVQIAPIFYPPATEVYAQVMNVIQYDYWKEYTVNPGHRIDLPIVGTEFTREQIKKIARKLYLRFYLRPQFIVNFLLRLRSFEEIKKAAKALADMVKE